MRDMLLGGGIPERWFVEEPVDGWEKCIASHVCCPLLSRSNLSCRAVSGATETCIYWLRLLPVLFASGLRFACT